MFLEAYVCMYTCFTVIIAHTVCYLYGEVNFSQKHNYKYMAKRWCLLAMGKLHVSAYSTRVAGCFSLQHGYYSNLTAPNLQHTANQEQNDQCGNSTA